MATRTVPGAYATIQAAVDASDPGDTVLVATSYAGNETIAVGVTNLTFNAPATVKGIALQLAASTFHVTLAGTAPISVLCGPDNNTVVGNAGDNYIEDSSFDQSEDNISGGGGADQIFSYSGFDKMSGDEGDDYFYLYGDGGFIDGGTGVDRVEAYKLTDYTFKNVEVLVVDGQGGIDTEISKLSSFSTIVNGRNTTSDSQFSFFLVREGGIFDFSTRIGGAHSVEVLASGLTSAVNLTGTVNADVLEGSEYRDTLDGGDGADLIRDWWGGGDNLKGSSGNDTFDIRKGWSSGHDGGSIDGGRDVDTVHAPTGSLLGYNFTNVEVLDADYVNATIKQIGSFSSIIVSDHYTSDDDRFGAILEGFGGSIDFANRLRDGRSLDLDASQTNSGVTVTATAKNDLLEGSKYRDTFRGGAGSDTYVVQNASDRVVEAANGGTADRVLASVSYALAAGQAVETLTTTRSVGTGTINLTGNELVQTIYGNAGANRLDGKGGADRLSGLSGDDIYTVDDAGDRVVEAAGGGTADRVMASVSYALAAGQSVEVLGTTSTTSTGALHLTGNELAQTVIGNAGVNRLDGKGGADTLTGLGGKDVFIFSTAVNAHDRITDFSVADDTIQLSKSMFTVLPIGNLSQVAFKDIGVAGAKLDGDDRIIYDHGTGALFYDADGSGTAHGLQQIAILSNHASLTSQDFLVV